MLYKMAAILKLLKPGLSSSWSFHEIGDASRIHSEFPGFSLELAAGGRYLGPLACPDDCCQASFH